MTDGWCGCAWKVLVEDVGGGCGWMVLDGGHAHSLKKNKDPTSERVGNLQVEPEENQWDLNFRVTLQEQWLCVRDIRITLKHATCIP